MYLIQGPQHLLHFVFIDYGENVIYIVQISGKRPLECSSFTTLSMNISITASPNEKHFSRFPIGLALRFLSNIFLNIRVILNALHRLTISFAF